MLRRLALCVGLVGLLLTACHPGDEAPLYGYNDTWEGELRLDGHAPLPLRADIYVTPVDVKRAQASRNLTQHAYAELALGGRVLAGWGDASHYDMRDVSQSVYSPVPEKEFLELNLALAVRELTDVAGSQAHQQQYASTYADLLSEWSLKAQTDAVSLVGENRGNVVEGVVVVVTTPSEGGVGVRRVRGTFRLGRSGVAPGVAHGVNQVETGHYFFHTDSGADGASYGIFIK